MSETKTVREWRDQANYLKGMGDAYTIVAKVGAVSNPTFAYEKAAEHFARGLCIRMAIAGKAETENVTI